MSDNPFAFKPTEPKELEDIKLKDSPKDPVVKKNEKLTPLEEMQSILKAFNNKESDIPVNHRYWSLRKKL